MRWVKTGLFCAVATVAGFATSSGGIAQTAIGFSQATQLIDVTARQRVLSQRVVKSACLTAAQVNFAANFSDLRQAHSDFKVAHYGLLNGSRQLNVVAITDEASTAYLLAVEDTLKRFSPVVDTLGNTGDINQLELINLDNLSAELNGYLNETIKTLGDVYQETLASQNLGLSLTLDIASRQAMLSQQLVKEMCLMHMLGNQSQNIQQTLGLFDASLNALIDGFPAAGVIPPPTQEIRDKLIEVKAIWETLKPIADQSAAGNIPDRDSLYMFSLAMEAVLRTTSEATDLYTQ